MRIAFSKSTIDAIKPPTTSRKWYRDTRLVGLSLMCTPANVKTFYLDVWRHGKRSQIRLGAYPELDVDRARQLARMELTSIEQGRPVVSGAMTFANLFNQWHSAVAVPTKRTAGEDRRKFDKDLGFLHSVPVRTMATRDIEMVLQEVMAKGASKKSGGRVNANRVLALVKTVLTWGVKRGYLERSPADPIDKFPEVERERFLQVEELARFMQAVEQQVDPWNDFFKLLIFTGARRGNVASMRWEDIDWSEHVWTIPSEHAKAKRIIRVPLIQPAMEILTRRKKDATVPWPFVFPSGASRLGHIVDPRKGWDRIMDAAGLQNVTMHDLRRTLGSYLAANNTSLHTIGKLLGHASNSKATSVYARLDLAPLRAAMDGVADKLTGRRK